MPQRLRIRLPGRLRLRHVAVALLALLGLVSLGIGIGLVTVWQPDDTLTSRAAVDEPGLVVTTAPGVLESLPGRVTVTARSSDGGPVLLAVGRERDVEAYVEGLPAATVTGFTETDPTVLTTSAVAGEAPAAGETPLADPAQSDLWVQQEAGDGEATLTYDPRQHPGRWLLVAAGDGTTPAPDDLTFTWPREVSTPWSTPLVVLGVLLLLAAAGLAAWLFWWSAVRPAAVPGRPADAEPGDEPDEPADEPADEPVDRTQTAVPADRTEEQR